MDTSGRIRELEYKIPEGQDWNVLVDDMRQKKEMEFRRLQEEMEGLKNNEIPLKSDEAEQLKKMSIPRRKNWMRNQSCLCGSGKKMKRCCWSKMASFGSTK